MIHLTQPISTRMLVRDGACADQVRLVRRHFGAKPLRLTRTRLLRAAKLGIDVGWLAQFLPTPARRAYNAAMAEPRRAYNAAMAEPRREHDAAMWRRLS